REHQPSVTYSAAASFLSCVGSFGESGDLVLLRSLRRLLRSGASLIMISFYIEGVDALLGEFTTKYASDSTVTLHTRSSFDVHRHEVVFNQRIEGEGPDSMHEIEEERIRLYTANEMRALLAGAGFSRVETFPECKLYGMRRSVDRSGVMLSLASA
ncbi:hypothetical protein V5F53_21610, partial [Xanthobacter sp. V4C-4]|uniref:hypothetical protein n=1 Tax=Xanthobacter cornucopiae TaxID=3119924 RepID=UPI003728C6F0